MRKITEITISKDIKRHFGFLFERGYEIRRIDYFPKHFGNWIVDLESVQCVIELYTDRAEIFLSFRPATTTRESQVGIEPMIYFLSGGRNFIGTFEGNFSWGKRKQFERLAKLLKEYIDEITPYFGSSFPEHMDELLLAQKAYNELLLTRGSGKPDDSAQS